MMETLGSMLSAIENVGNSTLALLVALVALIVVWKALSIIGSRTPKKETDE